MKCTDLILWRFFQLGSLRSAEIIFILFRKTPLDGGVDRLFENRERFLESVDIVRRSALNVALVRRTHPLKSSQQEQEDSDLENKDQLSMILFPDPTEIHGVVRVAWPEQHRSCNDFSFILIHEWILGWSFGLKGNFWERLGS